MSYVAILSEVTDLHHGMEALERAYGPFSKATQAWAWADREIAKRQSVLSAKVMPLVKRS